MRPFAPIARGHDRIREMLDELSRTTGRDREKREMLFPEVAATIGMYAEVEEAVVYPTLEELGAINGENRKIVLEHLSISQLLERLSEIPEDSPRWGGGLRRLQEEQLRHMEKEAELFIEAEEMLEEGDKDLLSKNIASALPD